MKEQIDKYLSGWLLYAIYLLLIVVSVNTCNSCTQNKKITKLAKEVNSLDKELKVKDSLYIEFKNQAATKEDIRENNDNEMARFLYWEREADNVKYKDYTIKDYKDLIEMK